MSRVCRAQWSSLGASALAHGKLLACGSPGLWSSLSARRSAVGDDDLRRSLVEVAAAWGAGQVNAADVVRVAVDAILGGLESTSLVLLAGLTSAEADNEVPDLLPRA